MDKKTFRPQRRIEKRYAAAVNTILKGLYRRLAGVCSPFQIRGFARSGIMNKAVGEEAQAMVTNLLKDEDVVYADRDFIDRHV